MSINTWFTKTLDILKTRGLVLAGIIIIPGLLGLILEVLPNIISTLGIGSIILGLVGSWASLSLIYSLVNNTSIQESYKNSLPLLVKFWLLGALLLIVTIGGYVLLIIPGIILQIYLSFTYYVFVDEGLKGWDAMKKSRYYIEGNFKQVALKYLALIGVMLVLVFLSMFVVGLLPPEFRDLAQYIVNTTIGIVAPSALYVLYQDLKSQKDQEGTTEIPLRWGYFILGILTILGIPALLVYLLATFNFT